MANSKESKKKAQTVGSALHPLKSPEEESKEGLTHKIQNLYETDFGDFKRKAILYCNNFSQSPSGQGLKVEIQDLKKLILLEEIDPSQETIENIDRLRQILIYHLEKM